MDKKMKTNQDGGSVTAKDSSAAGKQLEKNQEGAARMGYSQSFGAARTNGYAKGAAKVQDIMTNGGAAKYMKHGPADKGHGDDDRVHTHKSSGSYGLNPNSGGKGRKSLVGQRADNNLTITHDPQHRDLGVAGKLANSMLFDSTGSDDTYPGDHLNQVRRTGGSAGSVNRYGETKIGANFFAPEEKNKVKTKVVRSSSRDAFDGDQDGDTMFNDANQDGTMLGRGLSYLRSKF